MINAQEKQYSLEEAKEKLKASEYEDLYGIKIDLVNHDGLIQIDSDGSAIEVDYLDNSYFNQNLEYFNFFICDKGFI